jgi:hypothetical protein
MATLMSIDESPSNQVGTQDVSLPASGDSVSALNTYFGNTTWQSGVIQVAQKTGLLSGLQNTIDLALTNSTGAALNGVDSGINDLSGNDILLYTDSTNNNLVLGKLADGTVMFALYLDATGSAAGVDTNATGADLWMIEFKPIQHPDGTNSNDVVSIVDKLWTTVTNPISFDATHAPSGSSLFVAYGDGTPLPTEVGVIVTAVGSSNQSVTNKISDGNVVKASQAGSSLGGATFGINSQHFDGPSSSGAVGDAAYFTFVKGLATDLTVPNLSQGESDVEANIGFTSMFGATKVSFVVCQLQGGTRSTVKIEALVAGVSDAHGAGVADDTPWTTTSYIDHQDQNVMVDIDEVTITRGTSSWTFVEGQAKPAGAPSDLNVDFSQDGGLSAVISGAAEGDKIMYVSNSEHDRLYIGAPGNSNSALATPFDIGAIKIEAGGTNTAPVGQIDIYDDGPSITAAANTQTLTHDETPGVQANTDSNGTDLVAGAGSATIASLFSGVSGATDADVGTSPIGYARSTSALITVSGGSAGTDGAATQELTYGLHVVDGRDSGLKTTEGTEIFMYNGAGGVVLGRVGTEGGATDAPNANGAIAFALAVNPVNGEVFVAQYLSLNHPTGGSSYDEAISLNADAVQETVTRSDKDGDSAIDSDNNVGAQIKFEDDGPTITASSNTQTVTHDETPGIDSTDVAGTALSGGAGSATISSLFSGVSGATDTDVPGSPPIGYARSGSALVTATGGNAGADGPATQELSYGLHVVDGRDSGVKTTEGTEIFMYNGAGGVVLGRVGTEGGATDSPNANGAVAFALAVNPVTGEVFIAQYLSLNHPNTGSNDDSISLNADAVQGTVSRTDKDGDVASDTDNNIGAQINFEDDGPNIVAAPSATTVTHDETPGIDSTDVAGSALVVAGGASIASLFSGVTGGDDPDVADNPIGYARSTASMLSISTNAPGADGPAAQSLSYALSVSDGTPSGVSTSEGTQVYMYAGPGGLIFGRVGTEGGANPDSPNANGAIAFALAVNPANGELFVAQYLSLSHPNAASNDESIHLDAGAVQMSVTLTDKDGDTSTDSNNNIGDHINFEDDGPNANGTAVTATVDEDGATLGTGLPNGPGDVNFDSVATGSIAGIFGGGADGVKTYQLSTDTSGLSTSLKSQGAAVKYDVNADHTVLTGYVEKGANNVYDNGTDRVVFTLALSGTNNSNYTFTLSDQLDHPATDDPATSGTVETAFEDNLVLNLGSVLQVVDKDNDVATAAANKLAITVNDDSPVINSTDAQADMTFNNADKTGHGTFNYSIGTDDRAGSTYSASNSDLLLSFLSGNVGGTAISNLSIAWSSESGGQAAYTFGFDYKSNPLDPTAITHDTGTITFDKVLHTDTITLDNAIVSFSVLSLNDAGVAFHGYLTGTDTETGSQPPVSVAVLKPNFVVQFTGSAEPGGGLDGAKNYNIDAVAKGTTWSDTPGGGPTGDDTFTDGEIFQSQGAWVSVSTGTAGVAGDTMQQGEVLDFNFYDGNPTGHLTPPAGIHATSSSTIFMQFDGLDNGEDMVVLLKLHDPTGALPDTTRAVVVDAGDIFHKQDASSIPAAFGFTGTLDNNDGLVVIESQDYNKAGEHYQITGAQVLASTEGIVGKGINLNGAIGTGGGWNGTSYQSFADASEPGNTLTTINGSPEAGTWDGDVFKITNIGFVTETTPNAELNFGVKVHDYDGDTTGSQTITATINGGSSSATALSAMSTSSGGGAGSDLLLHPTDTFVNDYHFVM